VLPSLVTKREVARQVALVGILALSTCRYGPIASAQSGNDWKGVLQTDTLWTAQQSPYHVTGELTVPKDLTLTILAGTTVHFDNKARILIQGCLVADGTEEMPIQFNGTSSQHNWGGLQFDHTMSDSLIRYCVLEDARTDDGMIGLESSRLLLEWTTLGHCDRRRIRTLDSSLIVRNCSFADMGAPNEPPTTDNLSEHIWGAGIPDDGCLIVEGSVFGRVKGHNDAIDFDGPALPKPIPQIRGNLFLGGGDDALDLESDALIEGNVFMNFVRDRYNKASGESNALSAGAGKRYILSHNLFINAQHVAQVKDDAFLTFTNNTAFGISGAAIYFELGLPDRRPGKGALIRNCIFWQAPIVLAGVAEGTELSVDYSLLPAQWHDLGVGNIDADPCFAGPAFQDPNGTLQGITEDILVEGDYHLKSQGGRWDGSSQEWVTDDVTSPCVDAGDPNDPVAEESTPNGGRINMGAYGGTLEASKSVLSPPLDVIGVRPTKTWETRDWGDVSEP
jgi:predicted outer membrane repeat protein